MAENEKTTYFDIVKPHPDNNVSDEVLKLQQAFDIIDTLFHAVALDLLKKMDKDGSLTIENIEGLTEALANKMAKDRTFKLSEMTDVTGTENALDNYILTKSGAGFVLRSALAVIGIHTHDIANIVGLQAVLNTLAAGTSGVVDGEVTLFQGTGGKALKGSGVKLADLILSLDSKATSAQLTALSNAIANALGGKVNKAGDEGIGGYTTFPEYLGTSNGQTFVVARGTSNIKIIDNTGPFTLQAPADLWGTFAVIVHPLSGASSITALGFGDVTGIFNPIKRNRLYVTCFGTVSYLDIKADT